MRRGAVPVAAAWWRPPPGASSKPCCRRGRGRRSAGSSAPWTSNLGDGVGLAAAPLLIASETQDPLLVAAGALVQRLPWLVFGLYAGVLADRMDRRVLVVAVDLARAAVLPCSR